jgi:hypothetical protein
MVKASEKLEGNSTIKEIIEADNKAEEMMKKRQNAYKSSYLKILFGFNTRELKVMEDELKNKWIMKTEYSEVPHLKMSYQEELILLVEKLSNVKNLKVKQAELENALKATEKDLEDLVSLDLLMLLSGHQKCPKNLEAVKSAFTR